MPLLALQGSDCPSIGAGEAAHAEQLGDAAEGRQAAEGYYREAQRLLLPVGVVWTCREEYDRRMEAFERIHQKIYGLDGG